VKLADVAKGSAFVNHDAMSRSIRPRFESIGPKSARVAVAAINVVRKARALRILTLDKIP